MFRSGRSPKNDSTENQQHDNRPTQPSQPMSQPATAQAFVPPAQPAPVATQERAQPSTPHAVTESEALARDLRDGVVSGFVGGGTAVSGDAEFKGMLRVDGHFTGRIRSEKGSLIVSAGGVVDAEIEVATAKINGTVNGDIVATQRIEFGRSARVRGNIRTPALIVEEGAVFEGGCSMRQLEVDDVKPVKSSENRFSTHGPQQKTNNTAKQGHINEARTTIPVASAARASVTSNAIETA